MGKRKKRSTKIVSLLFVICSMFMSDVNASYAQEGIDEGYMQEETIEAYALPIESNDIQGWPEGPQIEAEAAIVIEQETGTILYAKNIEAKEYPASITKLMTVLVALENGNLNDTVTFSQEAVYSIEPGSSHLGIRPGEQLSLRQSLFGIMLASANDISNGVAEHIGGTIDHFVEMMNEKAEELGCINTHFVNAHGLHDDDHYVCAYDMALIAREVYKNRSFRIIAKTVECSFPPTNVVDEARYFVNHQKMLYDDYYKYEGCVGGKTGFTDEALNTLVTYAERDGTVLISVILRLNGVYRTFEESALLLDYGFDNFEKKTFSNQSTDEDFTAVMNANASEEFDAVASLANQSLQMDATSTVVVPKGTNMADLKTVVTKNEDDTGSLKYCYNDWTVGNVTLGFQEVETQTETVSESESQENTENQGSDATKSGEEEQNSEKKSIFLMIERGITKAGELIEKADEYILNHKVLCIVICVILLLIFVPMLILTYFRARKLSKRRKALEWEKEEIARIEREIDEKSTEEIEMELRAAMKRERQAQERADRAIEELEEAKRRVSEIEQKRNEMEFYPDDEEYDEEYDENDDVDYEEEVIIDSTAKEIESDDDEK
ncbi:MAG: D-alanyl-D-alanine carboxypeptidase [Lachnospiraceae bacterium]|nr:D-alanyl-D-alanine carboxypeptidase [Robinsoniella sp.]MDY3766329.1 D-alanyl-D-alanine carboxypeptidase [Lachnospiraceae bacterium]